MWRMFLIVAILVITPPNGHYQNLTSLTVYRKREYHIVFLRGCFYAPFFIEITISNNSTTPKSVLRQLFIFILQRELLFQQWDLDIDDYEPENPRSDYDKKYHGITNSFIEVKEKLEWTNQTFIDLYNKLENVNCMGISNRNPTEIEYGFKGMGAFSYLIFDENLNLELQEKYSDDCSQMFYKENVVLNYGSGAIGSFCTPEFKRTK